MDTGGTSMQKGSAKVGDSFKKLLGSAAVIASVGVAIAGAGAGF